MKAHISAPKTTQTIKALWRLEKIILDSLDFKEVVQKIVDGLLTELGYLKLGYRIIVLTLIDERKGVLQRISLSQTKEAEKALKASAVPFHDIEIPLNTKHNLLIETLHTRKPTVTHKWPDLFRPILTDEQAYANQKAAGIKTSLLYPVIVKDKAIGVVIFSMVKHANEVSSTERDLIRGFIEIVGLAVQNAKLYTSLESTTKKLRNANEQLKQLDTMKDEFVSIASHELRTPMTAIKDYLWMALAGKGGKLTEKQQYYLERSYNSTDRLIKLVNNMLNVSRIEANRVALDVQKTDIVELIDDVIAEIKPRADELGITLINSSKQVGSTKTSVSPVLADKDKIKEVLINFIGNSLKFSPKSSKITVSVNQDDGYVHVHVKDTGVGIKHENISKLFQKFGFIPGSYKTNQQATQGTGLGLYISKSIVELHQGKVWAESEGEGKGAIFSFSLKKFTEDEYKKMHKKYVQVADKGIIHSAIDVIQTPST